MIIMIRNIRKLLGKDIWRMIGPVICSALDSVLNSMMYGVLILTLLHLAEQDFTIGHLQQASLILTGVFLGRWLLQAVSFTQMQCIGADYTKKLRLLVGNHIRSLNMGFFNKNSIGRLNSTLLADITDFENIITHCICDFSKVVVFAVLSLAVTFFIHWSYGLMTLLLLLTALPFLRLSGRIAEKNAERLRGASQNVITRIVEYVAGIKTFRLYSLTGTRFARLDNALKDLKEKSIRSELTILPYAISFSSLTALLVPCALLLGAYLWGRQEVNLTAFLVIIVLAISLASMMSILGSLYPQVRSLTKATDNILAVLAEQPFPYTKEQTDFKNFDLAFRNVSFRYHDGPDVLKDITFMGRTGTKTALIGPSGSGKSTIVSLIARFWDCNSGAITIGGENINQYFPDDLNKHIAVVFQEVYLLNDTVMNNIRVGRPDAAKEEVMAAAKDAHCHDFIIAMEDGYDTMVGEGGSTLSGGEKQRISIARALLKDAPIVLLDETTSSLDADNEQEIQKAFDRLMKGKTVLVIAHRLKTIVTADQILVLKQGWIIESGSHKELLNQNGWYARMVREQEKAQQWVVKS